MMRAGKDNIFLILSLKSWIWSISWTFSCSSSSEGDDEEDLDDDIADNDDSDNWDQKPLLDQQLSSPSPQSKSQINTTSDTSWNTSISSTDCSISSSITSSLTSSSSSLSLTPSSLSSSDTSSLLDPMLTHHPGSEVAKLCNNNNNEDLMKDFPDFVDFVDTLHGMPDIDFEDNFEMFPCWAFLKECFPMISYKYFTYFSWLRNECWVTFCWELHSQQKWTQHWFLLL